MIEKLKEWFDGDLQLEDIRQIATYEYEIDTKGWYRSTSGYNIPSTLFFHMMKSGMFAIRIMKSTEPKAVGLWELECIVTIRFALDETKFKEVMENG